MRIGLVCPYSLSLPGGVQGQVLGLARALRSRGHDARVLGPCDGPPPDPYVTVVGPSIGNEANGSVAPIAPMPAAQLRTISAMWDEDFDVVHLHEPLVPGPSATTLVLKPAPLVGTFHAAGDIPEYRRFRGLVQWLGRRLDEKVAVSEAARDLVGHAIDGPWTILHNGVDTEHIGTTEPWPTQRPAILFVGRHEERKGLRILLEALEHVPGDLSVWIAGDGPHTDGLRSRYDDPRIEWLGRISDSERDARLRAATVMCAPSLGGESFGIVLVEGMAAGTPVVASDIDGYRQVAAGAAELVRPGDPVALGAALARVVSDHDASSRLRGAGLRRADELSMSRLADRYLEMYARVL